MSNGNRPCADCGKWACVCLTYADVEWSGRCPSPSPCLRILCDCDGVLSDFVGLVLDYVGRNTGLYYRREAVREWDCFAVLGLSEHWSYFRTQCDMFDLCRGMEIMPGARELWAEIERIDPDAKVCTTPMTVAWLSQRAAWLEAFGVPLKRQWQGEGKEAFAAPGRGDVLIDDKPENCEAFVRAGGRAFCIAAAYNGGVRAAAHVPRGTHAECVAWLRSIAHPAAQYEAQP